VAGASRPPTRYRCLLSTRARGAKDRPVEGSAEDTPPAEPEGGAVRARFSVRPRLAIFLVAVRLVAYTGLGALDNTLQALHEPDKPSYGISSLAPLGFHKAHPERVVQARTKADAQWRSQDIHTKLSLTEIGLSFSMQTTESTRSWPASRRSTSSVAS
jgi:hypothetical protein